VARTRPTASDERVQPSAAAVASRGSLDVLTAAPVAVRVRAAHWSAAADHDHVGVLRRQVASFAAAAGMPADDVAEVRIALSEALRNAAMHAYRDRDFDGDVSVDAEIADGELLISVRDYGIGISPHADSPGSGDGLTIIAQSCKRHRIRRCDGGGTEVRLCFDLARGDRPPPLI
jgi:anti-sigma regulatory factor (Ser/Thr protein kinase)